MFVFEVGKIYTMRSACDHNCAWTYTVTARTACTVTLTDAAGNTKRCRINKAMTEANGAESVKPLGSYSMAPVLSADHVQAEEPAPEADQDKPLTADALIKWLGGFLLREADARDYSELDNKLAEAAEAGIYCKRYSDRVCVGNDFVMLPVEDIASGRTGKPRVYEDRHGNIRCAACYCTICCDDCGDMPDVCPCCGALLCWDMEPDQKPEPEPEPEPAPEPVGYEVYYAPATPMEQGRYFGKTPIAAQAFGAAKRLGGYVKAVYADGSKLYADIPADIRDDPEPLPAVVERVCTDREKYTVTYTDGHRETYSGTTVPDRVLDFCSAWQGTPAEHWESSARAVYRLPVAWPVFVRAYLDTHGWTPENLTHGELASLRNFWRCALA